VLGVGAVGLTQMIIWGVADSVTMAKYRVSLLSPLRRVRDGPLQLPSIGWGQAILLMLFFVLGYTFYAALFAGHRRDSEHGAGSTAGADAGGHAARHQHHVSAARAEQSRGRAGTQPRVAPVLIADQVMPLRMSAVNLSPWEIGLSLFALAAGCYIAVWIGGADLRTGLLMYGKRPTFREVARWVRAAK
jgi:ABC-2 type transport system permease protein